MQRNKYTISCVMAGLLLLSACGSGSDDLYGGDDHPKRIKVGKPYYVMGQNYEPKYEPMYQEEGLASWYGPGFHGKSTASGERYNQNEMTAAHRTLPMPSIVKVTLLKTGKSINVRVNDRGPFSKKRIIDLSEKSAKEIGLVRYGVAEVKVEFLQEETEQYLAKMGIPEPQWMKDRRPVTGTEIATRAPINKERFSVVEYAAQYKGSVDESGGLPSGYVPSQSVADAVPAPKPKKKSFFSSLAFWSSDKEEEDTSPQAQAQKTYAAAELDPIVSQETDTIQPVHIAVSDEPAPSSASVTYQAPSKPAVTASRSNVKKSFVSTPFSEPSKPLEESEKTVALAENKPSNLMDMEVLPPVQDAPAPSASVSLVTTDKAQGYAVSAGAFALRENAEKQAKAVKPHANAKIQESVIAGAKVFRVVVDGLNIASAQSLKDKLLASGVMEARVIKN